MARAISLTRVLGFTNVWTYWVVGVATTIATGYAIYSMATSTGLAGWIEHLQFKILGSYGQKLTLLLMMLFVFGIGAAALVLTGWICDKLGVGAPSQLPAKVVAKEATKEKSTPVRDISIVMGGLFALSLLGLFGWHWWSTYEDKRDAQANYEPVAVTDGQPTQFAKTAHIALTGRALIERTLEHTVTNRPSENYLLVPIVAPNWSSGQSSAYIVKVKHLSELDVGNKGTRPKAKVDNRSSRGTLDTTLLGHLQGKVPVVAAQEFKRMGIPLADQAQLVRVIASEAGTPIVRDTQEAMKDTLAYALVLTVIFIVCWALLCFVMWRHERSKLRER